MELGVGGSGRDMARMQDRRSRPRRIAGWLACCLGYAVLVTPVGLLTLAAGPFAGTDAAAGWWQRLASGVLGRPADTVHRPGGVRVMGHAVTSTLLGLVGWLIIGAIAAMVARGAFYGLVDHGPYDTSWGGPSLAGAWLTHAAVSLPGIAVALVVLSGWALLHLRLTRWLHGARAPRWLLPAVVIVCVAAVLFVVAFLNQI